jgi:hypothetical protein
MQEKTILFVEDDPGQQDLFNDAIADWNAANSPKAFIPSFSTNFKEARQLLMFSRFDCALFDLRLPASDEGGKPSSDMGKSLAEIGLKTFGIPVAVISGNPSDFGSIFDQNTLVKSWIKEGESYYNSVIEWFADLWDMMDVLASVRSSIQESGADIFVRRIWPRWEQFRKLKTSRNQDITPIVTRQYVSHIAELLGLENSDNPGWHPFENYISPALLDDRANTGDIFKFGDELWVVLTPQCDMANKKIKSVLLAHCTASGFDAWDTNIAKLFAAISTNAAIPEKAVRYFHGLVNQNDEISKHFLPPIEGGRPLFVDFKDVTTKPLIEIDDSLSFRIASIAPPFLPNLVQRFGAYVSRTGQPNINIDHFIGV